MARDACLAQENGNAQSSYEIADPYANSFFIPPRAASFPRTRRAVA